MTPSIALKFIEDYLNARTGDPEMDQLGSRFQQLKEYGTTRLSDVTATTAEGRSARSAR